MEQKTITINQLNAKARQLANAEPDFVYGAIGGGKCSYLGERYGSEEGRPCIFGQAMLALGITREQIRGKEGEDIELFITENDIVIDNDPSGDHLKWAMAMQDAQDHRMPWGKAKSIADSAVEL